MLSAATTPMADRHRLGPLTIRRFTVPPQYNTAADEPPFKAVKTIGGFRENPERGGQRNRICRTGLAMIFNRRLRFYDDHQRNRHFVRERPRYEKHRRRAVSSARCLLPASPVAERVINRATQATPEVTVHETHRL